MSDESSKKRPTIGAMQYAGAAALIVIIAFGYGFPKYLSDKCSAIETAANPTGYRLTIQGHIDRESSVNAKKERIKPANQKLREETQIEAQGSAEPTQNAGNEPELWSDKFWCETTVSDYFIALFTLVLAAFTGFLWWSTHRLWAAGERALRTTERAFVYLEGFKNQITLLSDTDLTESATTQNGMPPDLTITRFATFPIWRNGGNTPTVNMKINVDWQSPGEAYRVGTFRNPETAFFLGPQSTAMSDMIEMQTIMAILTHAMRGFGEAPELFIWGRAEYEDIFGIRHWTQWCFKALPERHQKGQRLSVNFIQTGDYNQSDVAD